MAKQTSKEELFENYFHTTNEAFSTLEMVFGIKNVWTQVFGVDASEQYGFTTSESEQTAKDHVRASGAWESLSGLYEYAVNGILDSDHPEDVVIGGAEVLSYITAENHTPSVEWEQIVAKGDGRFALDNGMDISLDKVALLAGIDIRTVRNAISSGELVANKSGQTQFVENASARSWLQGRRGFKATVMLDKSVVDLDEVTTPTEFAAFLCQQRERIGLDQGNKSLTVFHPTVDAQAIRDLESGVFRLPLDTVFPIADFYHLDRKAFLSCVMRIFFEEQLTSLRETLISTRGA